MLFIFVLYSSKVKNGVQAPSKFAGFPFFVYLFLAHAEYSLNNFSCAYDETTSRPSRHN